MKIKAMLLTALGFFTGTAQGATVTITSSDVTSAADIEMAISTATNFGTEPGTVILDGGGGSFVYSGPDRSINIFVSDLRLEGINDATIANCDDGIFFDDFALHDILIEDITFRCTGDGVDGVGLSPREDVTIRRNVFEAEGFGIIQSNAVNWTILNNTVAAGTAPGQAAVALLGGRNSRITNNTLSAFQGVLLTSESGLESTGTQVTNNRITALETGIRLEGNTDSNKVTANRIAITSFAGTGIFLGGSTSQNKVHGNRASIVAGGSLTTVQDLGEDNKVSGNKP